jgi:ABC-type sugar transport system permease subunit
VEAAAGVKVRYWLPWVYAAPMIVFIGMIFAFPVVSLFSYSLQSVSTSSTTPSTFVGLSNYRYIFDDSLFIRAIVNNLKLFLCVPVMVVLRVLIAAVLYDRPRGWKVYRHFSSSPTSSRSPSSAWCSVTSSNIAAC